LLRHGIRREAWTAAAGLAVLLLVGFAAGRPLADDPASSARQLSAGAQSFLNQITKSTESGASAVLGAVAGFAGDAETLAGALTRGDGTSAAAALVSVESDRAAVDAAIKANPGVADASAWAALKLQLDHIAIAITATAPPASAYAPAPVAHNDSGVDPSSGAPRVVIESRTVAGNALRVQGWLEGKDLRTAGIYEGDSQLSAFNLDKVRGMQRVSFDLHVGNARPGVVIRVYQADGSSAEAPLETNDTTSPDGAGPPAGSGEPPEAAAGLSEPSVPTAEIPRTVSIPSAGDNPSGNSDENSNVTDGDDSGDSGFATSGNTAEIPTHAAAAAAPDAATEALNGVRINIMSMNMVSAMPRRWEVTGQIIGAGVHRAGVYVNGRQVQNITISYGAPVSAFDTTFQMMTGTPTIRAFGIGDQYVETAIQPGMVGAPYGGPGSYVYANPPAAAPYGYSNPPAYGAPYQPYGYGGAPSPYGNSYTTPNQPPWWQKFIP